MSRGRLVLHQFTYDLRTFLRDPAAVFFTGFLPILFLVLFVGVFGNQRIPVGHDRFVAGSTYFVPSILALAIISATAVNLSISLATVRERGTLKRLRATPLPPSAFLMARVLTQIVVVTVLTVIVIGFGRVVYDVALPGSAWPALLLTLFVGIGSFCGVGFAMTLAIRSEGAAAPIANAITLPLNFMSGIFFPRGSIPKWMSDIAAIFPVKHLVDAVFRAFDPTVTGSRFSGVDVLILAAWGLGSLIVAARFFRWTPNNR